jgi:hypothetical protein
MSHVPDDPTKTPKPGEYPDKTKQPGLGKEFEKRGDKRPGEPAKPQQDQPGQKQQQNDQSQKH